MARSVLNLLDDFLYLFVLVLKILQSILLLPVLAQIVFKRLLCLYIYQTFLELASELIDDLNEFDSDAHDHIANVLLPPAQVSLGIPVLFNGLLCLAPDLVELLHRCNVALINVLDVVFVDEAGQTLESLLLGGEEVEPAPVDGAPLPKPTRRSVLPCLHHCLYYVKSRR